MSESLLSVCAAGVPAHLAIPKVFVAGGGLCFKLPYARVPPDSCHGVCLHL